MRTNMCWIAAMWMISILFQRPVRRVIEKTFCLYKCLYFRINMKKKWANKSKYWRIKYKKNNRWQELANKIKKYESKTFCCIILLRILVKIWVAIYSMFYGYFVKDRQFIYSPGPHPFCNGKGRSPAVFTRD